ncbi:ATP synthase subunit a [Actinoplanes lobatus]|uniref:ATP synthase subunit a n=1 Tax=Actinoplanes lobatus TaxID=113568 RepID=A0A7W7HB50_9ACTN|nr:F0F1 ATP synthase subunit A [Actinoplanes lobatus]MBB4746872.1 F-type H+-transporting ATPase subunit a [Actinoplanes lobatus]GGN54618.1 ATP synthase subunit a [Actinoplanes lobatus]GIE41695.1 ATP synthase subunit a [Actinoplanes lobatus]
MTGQSIVLAADVPFPPSVEDFYLPSILPWGAHDNYWFTKITLLVWLTVAILIVFFLAANRKPQLVPTKGQWLAESIYGFVRNNVAVDMIGPAGIRFAPYLTTLFMFILLNNFWGIVPFVQMSPNSHIAFPAVLAVISYVMFIYVGIRHHGFFKYFKHALVPPAPWFILPLLVPIELFSNFIVRPFSLAVRLFANMFAGHMLLLVFTLGGFAMISANGWLAPVSVLSWALTIALTMLEFLVICLQAYVFTVLTASYVQGALADEH